MFLINESTNPTKLYPQGFGHGAVPRDYSVQPLEMMASPKDMKLIPRSDWDGWHDRRKAEKSGLLDLRKIKGPNGGHIPSLDQNGQGYCWSYSTVMCVMMRRMANNEPYKRLSAHSLACREMNFANRGGWCGLSAQRLRNEGVNDVTQWPEKSMSRSLDTAESRKLAAANKVKEDWVDLTHPVHSQNLTIDQIATCLLQNIPVAMDFDWWGHSVCAIDWVKIEAGSWGPVIINSWTDGWGELGTGVIQGSRINPMGAVAIVAAAA